MFMKWTDKVFFNWCYIWTTGFFFSEGKKNSSEIRIIELPQLIKLLNEAKYFHDKGLADIITIKN